MIVVSYLKGIPPSNKNPEKPAILTKFIQGVNLNSNDSGVVSQEYSPIQCDVAVLQGYVHQESQNLPHLNLRKEVLNLQNFNNKRTIIIDSNLFLYRDPGNSKKYLRYSYDGVFPTTGEYCNETVDPARWEQIKKDLNFDLQPWKLNKRKYILICAQRDGGWSMHGKKVVKWIRETVAKIQKISPLPIRLRLHPGDGSSWRYIKEIESLPVTIVDSKNISLLEDLQEAHSVVVYNSSPAVASVIEGIPTFVTDPNPRNCQAYGVVHTDLKDIINPTEFDRSQWILKMAQMHWNQQDLVNGTCWNWMRKWALK